MWYPGLVLFEHCLLEREIARACNRGTCVSVDRHTLHVLNTNVNPQLLK